MRVYKRSFVKRPIGEFNGYVWFSLDPEYGHNTYGHLTSSYILSHSIKLFDIGKSIHRQNLIDVFVERSPTRITRKTIRQYKFLLEPDEQYSCCESNTRAHQFIQSVIGNSFDGTIINEANADEYLKGASEVVLWNFGKIREHH